MVIVFTQRVIRLLLLFNPKGDLPFAPFVVRLVLTTKGKKRLHKRHKRLLPDLCSFPGLKLKLRLKLKLIFEYYLLTVFKILSYGILYSLSSNCKTMSKSVVKFSTGKITSLDTEEPAGM